MRSRIKEYIGTKSFYRSLIFLALPVMLQSGLTNLVSLLDNLMVGAVGTDQMNGVSIVNQCLFVFNLCIFGGLGGVGIFTAQFYGNGTIRVCGTLSASRSSWPSGYSPRVL